MAFFKRKEETPFVSAIIAAAGTSSRMDGIDKQQFLLDGIPVAARSIGAFCGCPLIGEVVVVCRREQTADFYDMIRFFDFPKIASVIAGGETRQDSVFAAVGACSKTAAFYAIHDGARPLVRPEDIAACLSAAFRTGAAATGVPVKDTVKILDENGVITSTPDRERLWAVQTPQIFDARLYQSAIQLAIENKRSYSDDCQLIENYCRPVTMVEGSYENIKITTPEDIAVAMAILRYREEGLAIWEE